MALFYQIFIFLIGFLGTFYLFKTKPFVAPFYGFLALYSLVPVIIINNFEYIADLYLRDIPLKNIQNINIYYLNSLLLCFFSIHISLNTKQLSAVKFHYGRHINSNMVLLSI